MAANASCQLGKHFITVYISLYMYILSLKRNTENSRRGGQACIVGHLWRSFSRKSWRGWPWTVSPGPVEDMSGATCLSLPSSMPGRSSFLGLFFFTIWCHLVTIPFDSLVILLWFSPEPISTQRGKGIMSYVLNSLYLEAVVGILHTAQLLAYQHHDFHTAEHFRTEANQEQTRGKECVIGRGFARQRSSLSLEWRRIHLSQTSIEDMVNLTYSQETQGWKPPSSAWSLEYIHVWHIWTICTPKNPLPLTLKFCLLWTWDTSTFTT